RISIQSPAMQVLGIVGGVASGKTLASGIFSDLGAVVLNADEIGHQVLRDPEILEAAQLRWGDGILDTNGQIDRRRVAAIVFADTPAAAGELQFLENLTHPQIARHLRKRLDHLAAGGTKQVVLDAALLLKTAWRELCDVIVFLETPYEIRQKRASARGWHSNELGRREARQLPLDFKRSEADLILDNSGTPEQLRQEIQRHWDSLFTPNTPK
ncbi:MAG: dephospho-CoA kinase, partial [Planctomycetales bacterium]